MFAEALGGIVLCVFFLLPGHWDENCHHKGALSRSPGRAQGGCSRTGLVAGTHLTPPIALILHRARHLCLSQVLLCVAAIASSKL